MIGTRVMIGSDLELATVWNTVNMLEPLSPLVQDHGERNPRRAAESQDYMAVGQELFGLTSVEECDVAVLPFAWEDTRVGPDMKRRAEKFLEEARSAGKSVLVFHHEDQPVRITWPNAVVFRRSLHRSSKLNNEFGLPPWVIDPVGRYLAAPASLRPYSSRPTVSFCGYAPPLGVAMTRMQKMSTSARDVYRRVRTKVGLDERRGFSPPMFYRADSLRALQRSEQVDTNFVLRAVGSEHLDPKGYRPIDSSLSVEQYNAEYFENMVASDYVLAVRGLGNYSVRFYEAMACGRIPLFVDTDCVLPPLRGADWDAIVVRIDRREIRHLGRCLQQEHGRMGPEEFQARQARARSTWLRSLTMAGFFRSLHMTLTEVLSDGPIEGEKGTERLCRALMKQGS